VERWRTKGQRQVLASGPRGAGWLRTVGVQWSAWDVLKLEQPQVPLRARIPTHVKRRRRRASRRQRHACLNAGNRWLRLQGHAAEVRGGDGGEVYGFSRDRSWLE